MRLTSAIVATLFLAFNAAVGTPLLEKRVLSICRCMENHLLSPIDILY